MRWLRFLSVTLWLNLGMCVKKQCQLQKVCAFGLLDRDAQWLTGTSVKMGWKLRLSGSHTMSNTHYIKIFLCHNKSQMFSRLVFTH